MTILVDDELVLYGYVGENFWDECFTASDVIYALAEVGCNTDITVRINSGENLMCEVHSHSVDWAESVNSLQE